MRKGGWGGADALRFTKSVKFDQLARGGGKVCVKQWRKTGIYIEEYARFDV